MLGHHRHASETPFQMAFRWRADDGPFSWYIDSPSLINYKKTYQIWTPSDKTFWIRA